MGNRSAKGLGDDLSIVTWYIERKSFLIGRIPLKLDGDSPDIPEINAMIKRYNKMTDFLWPSNWTSLVRVLCTYIVFYDA